jgi:hypothetical protein
VVSQSASAAGSAAGRGWRRRGLAGWPGCGGRVGGVAADADVPVVSRAVAASSAGRGAAGAPAAAVGGVGASDEPHRRGCSRRGRDHSCQDQRANASVVRARAAGGWGRGRGSSECISSEGKGGRRVGARTRVKARAERREAAPMRIPYPQGG